LSQTRIMNLQKRNIRLKGKQEVQWLNSGERRLIGGKKEVEKRNGKSV
jgi:hypothetical protein